MRLIDADALKEKIVDNSYLITYDYEFKSVESGMSLTGIQQAIDEMPTVEQNKWIPCSERLPEKDGEYLVESTRGYEVLYYREKEKQFGLMVYNFAGKVGFVPKKVYEWMPIPGGGRMTTVILGSFAWGFLTCVMIVALFERER